MFQNKIARNTIFQTDATLKKNFKTLKSIEPERNPPASEHSLKKCSPIILGKTNTNYNE